MTLTRKVLLYIISIFVFTILFIIVSSNVLIKTKFGSLEDTAILNNLHQAENAIKSKQNNLSTIATDYATWDDTYAYVQDKNTEYEETNIISETYSNLKINLFSILDINKTIIYQGMYDLEKSEIMETDPEIIGILPKIIFTENLEPIQTIVNINSKLMLLTVRPILHSNKSGPINGFLIMGRFIDNNLISEISETINSKMEIININTITDFTILDGLAHKKYFVDKTNKKTAVAYLSLNDYDNKASIIVKMSLPRDVYNEGQNTIRILMFLLVLIGVVSVLLGNQLLKKILLGPIIKLTNEIKQLKKNNITTARLNADPNDELYIITAEINELLDQIEKIDTRLISFNKHIETVIDQRTAELKEEHSKLVTAISSSPYGFLLFNLNKDVILSNDAILKILGTSEISYEIFAKAIPQDDVVRRTFEKVLAIQDNISINDLATDKKYVNLFARPIFNGDQDITGVIFTIIDVTDIKLLERSKDEFFAIASHELKTPLTAIKGNISLIKDLYYEKITDENIKTMLEDISTASQRMLKIVNDFLTTAKLDHGKMPFNSQNFALSDIIRALITDWNALASEKGITISYFPAEKLSDTEVFADKERTKEVISNLISNAIKYMGQGKITINTRKNNNFIEVEVKDNGKGISLENQALLFKKFQQAGSKNLYTRDSLQGTGLGLYICKLIVEGMGGKIYLKHSKENLGTSFVFTLPIKRG